MRVGRIELPTTAWKAVVIPLNYTRIGSAYTTRLADKLKRMYYLPIMKTGKVMKQTILFGAIIFASIAFMGAFYLYLFPKTVTVNSTALVASTQETENVSTIVATTTAESIEEPIEAESKKPVPVETKEEPILAAEELDTQTLAIVPSEPFYTTPAIPFDTINEYVAPTLVNILCGGNTQNMSGATGSGVMIDPRGVILTNAHVAQYVLLQDHKDKLTSCVIRTGSPAKAAYTAQVLMFPTLWAEEHAQDIHLETPTGTGEHDWALLYITGTVDGTSKPLTFPFVAFDSREGVAQTNDPVLLASYPAGFLGSINLQRNLWPVSTTVSVQKVYTFTEYIIDILALGGNIVAQGGSSGGAVVNQHGNLVGVIVTSSIGNTTQERDLRAVTLSHIDRSIETHTEHDLLSF